jgi:hypothetical protein
MSAYRRLLKKSKNLEAAKISRRCVSSCLHGGPLDFLEADQAVLPDGQIISDFPKSRQALKSKIFRFRRRANQWH